MRGFEVGEMEHRLSRFVVLVCALATVFSLFLRTLEAGSISPQLDSARTRPDEPVVTSAAKAPTPRVASSATPAFGVEAANWSPANAASQAGRVTSTGATWTRFNQLQWSIVQPQETSGYDWTSYNTIMLALAQQPLTPIVIIGDTPNWAQATTQNLPSGPIDPTHLGEFAAFVQAAVNRYSQSPYNIHYWEFFNEPDSTLATWVPEISTWGNDGPGYAAMLRQAYPAVKIADPGSTVVMGSVAFERFTTDNPTGPFNKSFIDDVLNAGGGPYFDLLGYHYYANFAPVWKSYGVDILGKTNYLRGVLAAHGLASRPMVCTEMGQFGVPGDPTSLAAQANYVPQVYARGMSAGVVSMMWYSLLVGTSDSGLLYADGSPKPAYFTYQFATAELGHLTYTQTISAADVRLTGPAAAAFEGYLFQDPGSGAYRAVVWQNSGSAILSIRLPSLDEVTVSGTRTHVLADTSGQVSIALDTNPLYLELPTNPFHSLYLPFVTR